jgi:hypothetical protein
MEQALLRSRHGFSVAIQKLGARNRIEAAHIAEQKGWLQRLLEPASSVGR